jgi:hypothetical protein
MHLVIWHIAPPAHISALCEVGSVSLSSSSFYVCLLSCAQRSFYMFALGGYCSGPQCTHHWFQRSIMNYETMTKETTNVARATCSSIFKIFINCILKFQDNLKLNLYVDNVVFYQHANFQLEIPYIRGCAKITKSNISIVANSADFQSLKICKILSFLCSPELLWVGTLVEHTIMYIYIFFLKLQNADLEFQRKMSYV